LTRAATIWPELPAFLPECLVFYIAETPEASTPWGVAWVRSAQEIPEICARLSLEALSPLGLPAFSTLVEGVLLWLTQPTRDFRAEAKEVLKENRWVSLTQNLFGVYPRWLVEAEAGVFVKFVVETYGPQRLRAFWQATEEGASPFRAAETCLGTSFSTLEEELVAWIKQP
ncbi:MAG: hypothetical protein NZ651_03035, partial [Candidatus Bipolaricaulota bacterium]|nr:hypothetical protein [Candidatus Bipolaricaulota bacterium]MDW8126728.1 hypothetical protein [Candidatus Bipolaricaulota bacterium]